ncbi:dipeptidyl peptidase III [Penicillium odoratum]|uniref:dipeptidyl peptidase III n=1 Tax=Penicillium odoratum TaxID=1167516 RepID=UPI002547E83A|nr:dipeptidyl peptidase III [Penicillium odoratum]KAJ5751690.1 dipeptidyl peptidase III [Penicillium odoratum]
MAPVELYADLSPSVFRLDIAKSFEQLDRDEKLYSHFMSKAAYQCTRIVLRQVSQESEHIFDLIIELAKQCNCQWEILQEKTGVSAYAIDYFLDYAAIFLDSLGNYRGYGDRKIIPRLSAEEFRRICAYSETTAELYKTIENDIFSEQPASIGFPDQGGMSAFYPCSPDISKVEIEEVQRALLQHDKHLLDHTRLKKIQSTEGPTYLVIVASSSIDPPEHTIIFNTKQPKIDFQYGDYAAELEKVRKSLQESARFTCNEHQKQYIEHLAEFLRTGHIETHRQAAISWVQNKGPVVEANIGFLTAYRDPAGLRRSCEGLVAIKNKEESRTLNKLTESVNSLLGSLPWVVINQYVSANEPYGPFEKPRFVKPDFVSLDVLSFCGVTCWSGISGPTYQDVKQVYGKKHILFSNRTAAVNSQDKVPFLNASDQKIFKYLRDFCLRIMIAVHELIGHGCGKNLAETSPSVYNFDYSSPPINPLTGDLVKTWYKVGESAKSLFGSTYAGMNECIAELVTMHLLSNTEILTIFELFEKYPTVDAETFEYVGYLQIITLGLRGVMTYDHSKKKWGQAHDKARFAIVRYLCEFGNGVLEIKHHPATSEAPADLAITLNKDLIPVAGRQAIYNLLLRLQVYLATADLENGQPWFEALAQVDENYLLWQEAVKIHHQQRPIFVQANTILQDSHEAAQEDLFSSQGEVLIQEYPSTREGVIRSWVDRYTLCDL